LGSILGHRVERVEDRRLLTEGGTYVEDLDLPGAARVTYVRSPFAHARITGIDLSEAKAAPGVLAVLTGDDLAELGSVPASPGFPGGMDQPFLAHDVVRYVGEAVVAIVAEGRASGADAADLVVVDYEPLPVVVDVDDAVAMGEGDERLLFPEAGTNVVMRLATPSPADFAGCEVVVEERIANQRVAAAPLEPRSAAAHWTEDGRLVYHLACQGAHPARDLLATTYGLPPEQVRVVVPDVGGGFGAKARALPDELALGFLARVVGRPVRWTETRSENMVAMAHGRAQWQWARLGGTRDGRITAYQLDVVQDAGAYPLIGAQLPFMTMMMTTGAHAITNAGFSSVSVVTNTAPTGAYRGAGRPEATLAIERMIDRFAAEIGMDPAEVRRRNLVPRFTEPHTTPTGTTYDVGDYPEALERALAAARYDDLRAEQARRRAAGDPVVLGIGISTYVEITALGGGGEFAAVEVLDGGRVRVVTGSTPSGQGHDTTWAMIAADRLGVAVEDVEVVHGDTDRVERGGLTGGSRSVQLAGAAVADACGEVVELARQRAGEVLEAAVDDIVLAVDGDSRGRFHVVGTPARSLGWADLVADGAGGVDGVGGADGAHSGGPVNGDGFGRSTPDRSAGGSEAGDGDGDGRPALAAEVDHRAKGSTFPFGAHIAVVEVDTETGGTRLRQMVAVDDAGRIVNPLLAEGQVHGGIAQGVAQALLEAVHYDDDGQPLTTNFADYLVISATELPSFDLVPMETPTWVNELGAKGIGESGTIGSVPAVYNAVVDALGHLGIVHLETPLTPERIWTAVTAARSAG
jgi:carbon-monoxide dehydrogenase large subunit